MQKEPKCEACRFFFPLKEAIASGDWIIKNVCCLWPVTDGARDAFAVIVSNNDKCEMFEERNR